MKDSHSPKQQKNPEKKFSLKKIKPTLAFGVTFLFLLSICLFGYLVFLLQELNVPIKKDDGLHFKSISSIPRAELSNGIINASASAYLVYDISSRSIVAGKNENLRFSPASTAKIMTALLSLEHYNLDDYVIVPNLTGVQGSKMDLYQGEEIRIIDLLYGLMLPSGNDAAYTLSYYYPGGREGFVSAMNKKAQDLQMVNTYFADPAGYEDTNYTTATELARLAATAMENKTFAQIVRTRQIYVYDRTLTAVHNLRNINELLKYDEVVGIKTGFTNEAQGVLVTAIKQDGKTLIVVVLKSPDRFYDTQTLMEFIREKVRYTQLP